jgi:hypothetical protein
VYVLSALKSKVTPLIVSVRVAGTFELNVDQSAELNAPLFAALAVGTFKVITGVVVPVATVLLKSVPVVPNVKAATLVTVPPDEGAELVIVKFG